MNKNNSLFLKFLGAKRWQELYSALKQEFNRELIPDKNFAAVFISLLLCLLGPVIVAFELYYRTNTSLYSTLGFGISAIFAILFQRTIKRTNSSNSLKNSLSLTHTAFALGCIPALIVVALDPSLLAKREQLLGTATQGTVEQVSKATYFFMIALFTLWVAITEEYLFRALLVSIIRRANFLKTPVIRTTVACLFSSILFGLSHWPLWGAGASLALTGLGIGLALGYIANGERIWPMIIYHWGFDFLSTTIALLGR